MNNYYKLRPIIWFAVSNVPRTILYQFEMNFIFLLIRSAIRMLRMLISLFCFFIQNIKIVKSFL